MGVSPGLFFARCGAPSCSPPHIRKPKNKYPVGGRRGIGSLERLMGVEPTYAAWEAAVLPMNYTRR